MRHKLIQILKGFTETDIENFNNFIKSPFFNKEISLVKFYEIVISFHPSYDLKQFNRENLILMYSNFKDNKKRISESTLTNLFADLLNLCYEYLAQCAFQVTRFEKDLKLIAELVGRNNKKISSALIDKLVKKISTGDHYIKDLFVIFNLQTLKDDFLSESNVRDFVKIDSMLKSKFETTNYFFYFCFVNMFSAYLGNISLCDYLKIDYRKTPYGKFFNDIFPDDKIFKIISSGIAKKNYFYENYLKLFWYYYQIKLKKDIPNNLKFYKYSLDKISSKLHIDEKFNFYTIIWSLHHLSLEIPDIEIMEFEFYDDYLKNEGFYSNGFEHLTLRNFLFLFNRAFATNRIEWGNKFIEKYSVKLNPVYKDSALNFRDALFETIVNKNYNLALQKLSKCKDENEITLKRDIIFLYIIIFYDLKNKEMVKCYVSKLKVIIKNKKTPELEIEIINSFLKPINILLNSKLHLSKLNSEKLIMEIKKSKFVLFKQWFIFQLNKYNIRKVS